MDPAPQPSTPQRLVVMGVQGSGKSTLGRLLAERLGAVFIDADDLHPEANRRKMASGMPLDDDDRRPWLDAVAAAFAAAPPPVVLACSALRRRYRDRVREAVPDAVFVHPAGTRSLLRQRLAGRDHEFMPARLLDGQLATLEPLEADEAGFDVTIGPPPGEIVDGILERLAEGEPGRLGD
ncbi:gluconokinase [Agromyces archimandritae]|uniref:Gluconokinase n=1 Tax=Agromyces archimandritae TaxID=2781962 RepID=A0A975IPL9_9MICO|nr:gluconokinase, GntK/IdnK-type [Agromyces archimandritae]QTX04146.1 AAA family ATPase [Agromyces archimandritae]